MATPSLILIPDTELQFTLSSSEDTPKSTMTLKHPGGTNEYMAFKVKTTQPRRYLVRPNQGLIAPGSSDTVSILLVEKEKNLLLQSYERLGQSALDHAKDKFLVQSCPVPDSFSSQFKDSLGKGSDNSALYEALNKMWTTGDKDSIQNKKLHVRLVVDDGKGNTSGAAGSSNLTAAQANMLKPHETSMSAIENMTPPQLFAEISNLRKKYDELVSFSVNLTAERDILNNTLEQTKRELNKEMSSRAALENKGGVVSASGSGAAPAGKGNLLMTIITMLIVAMAAFLGGVRAAKIGQVDFIEEIPHIGEFFVPDGALPLSGGGKAAPIVQEEDEDEEDE